MNTAPPKASAQMKMGILGWILIACSVLYPPILSAQQDKDAEHPQGKWEVLENCRLLTNTMIDGDSFHVMHKGREYIFRLYFVDAPETDPALTERLKDQAAYFGLAVSDIPRAGELAAKFTREKLAGHDFTVVTRWQNAMGRSRLVRFYAIVLVNGKNLAEELTANGLARIYGLRADWPDGARATTFINQLKNHELTAREQRRGIWDERAFLRARATKPDGAGTNTSTNQPLALVELNTATFEELKKLPGIGDKLAERIIAHRPYKKVDDLEKVSGIGKKTMERLRPLVRIGEEKP